MLQGEKVALRPFTREDVPLIWKFRTDVEVELAGGGDPPKPLTLERIYGEYDRGEFIFREGFAIEADNERAIRCYKSCGFQEEGRQREHAWSNGRYVDNLLMGILREEWEAR